MVWQLVPQFSSSENLLIVSKLPTLKVRKLRTMAIEVYKILHKESPSYLQDSKLKILNIEFDKIQFKIF
jgi:hypothetical protein